uniref:Uncharacterized protein n=1 Tax=Timspurckia oligopyrenoides TaxID=708627 RepID=A0A7S0ZCU3_9RHOD|mmetsp:Transcript_12786/g.22988  ORF Transcript_12786/g.22988 Transcript_12786/m.22988 type:complete len:632 (+) Transcript_12786:91-1986(+)|eukprot:CAMPEP_0182451408 /NCGR_PEP_ID=MMETSP1172-20130603/43706_1 /TAXON_ID=708627 /ORGANISM="Timspurckia oligopyrenoides, Strain CCMP3278" /LENGTH=631 /DNA_ID=CAMNT_0024649183 /DNA_START=77 /DNA_END=1972 /DNA_ORIENTATION=-
MKDSFISGFVPVGVGASSTQVIKVANVHDESGAVALAISKGFHHHAAPKNASRRAGIVIRHGASNNGWFNLSPEEIEEAKRLAREQKKASKTTAGIQRQTPSQNTFNSNGATPKVPAKTGSSLSNSAPKLPNQLQVIENSLKTTASKKPYAKTADERVKASAARAALSVGSTVGTGWFAEVIPRIRRRLSPSLNAQVSDSTLTSFVAGTAAALVIFPVLIGIGNSSSQQNLPLEKQFAQQSVAPVNTAAARNSVPALKAKLAEQNKLIEEIQAKNAEQVKTLLSRVYTLEGAKDKIAENVDKRIAEAVKETEKKDGEARIALESRVKELEAGSEKQAKAFEAMMDKKISALVAENEKANKAMVAEFQGKIKEKDVMLVELKKKSAADVDKLEEQVAKLTKENEKALATADSKMKEALAAADTKMKAALDEITKKNAAEVAQLQTKLKQMEASKESALKDAAKESEAKLLEMKKSYDAQLKTMESNIAALKQEKETAIVSVEKKAESKVAEVEKTLKKVEKERDELAKTLNNVRQMAFQAFEGPGTKQAEAPKSTNAVEKVEKEAAAPAPEKAQAQKAAESAPPAPAQAQAKAPEAKKPAETTASTEKKTPEPTATKAAVEPKPSASTAKVE